jgi:hypothetical protein
LLCPNSSRPAPSWRHTLTYKIRGPLNKFPEGAAAAPIAALLNGLVTGPAGSRVARVLSGGNVNLDQLKGLRWN